MAGLSPAPGFRLDIETTERRGLSCAVHPAGLRGAIAPGRPVVEHQRPAGRRGGVGRAAGLSGQTPPTFFPFHSLRAKRWYAPKGPPPRPDRARLSAQPVSHRPTGAATPATSSLPAGCALSELGHASDSWNRCPGFACWGEGAHRCDLLPSSRRSLSLSGPRDEPTVDLRSGPSLPAPFLPRVQHRVEAGCQPSSSDARRGGD